MRRILGLLVLIVVPALGRADGFTSAAPMSAGRAYHTLTPLDNDSVLVAGGFGDGVPQASAEIFHRSTGTWTAAAPLLPARGLHTATRFETGPLAGKVLVVGGWALDYWGISYFLDTAELYDPALNTWTPAGSLNVARVGHTATLLDSGKVLVTGGECNVVAGEGCWTDTAELYDPATNAWSLLTARLNTVRYTHTATKMKSGQVLIVGGNMTAGPWAEVYDPDAGTFAATREELLVPTGDHTATLLEGGQNGGKVLVVGGRQEGTTAAQLYDPANGTWALAASMGTPRRGHTATLLKNGKVLVTGGVSVDTSGPSWIWTPYASAELYDPASDAWTATTTSLSTPRFFHAAVAFGPDGQVLVTGGYGLTTGSLITSYFQNVADLY